MATTVWHDWPTDGSSRRRGPPPATGSNGAASPPATRGRSVLSLLPFRRRHVSVTGHHEIRTVTVHGHRRAFVLTGSGPAVLLLHGIGSDSTTWDRVIPELARDFTVIAPDLLGHGRSDKPRGDYSLGGYASGMRDLLTVLGIERVSVVGHSFGGGVAMQFAYQFPERCERIVLIGSGGVARDVHPLLRLLSLPGGGLVTALATSAPVRPWVSRLGTLLAKAPLDAVVDVEELLTVMESLSHPHGRRAFLRLLRTVIDVHGQSVTMLDRCYLTQAMPTMLLWGEKDSVIPVAHAHQAHAVMPGSRLVVVPGAGHFPHREEPGTVIDELREFLGSTTASSYDRTGWREMLVRGEAPALGEQSVATR